jgi:Ca2+-binding RTX toxin-like protein
MSGKLSRRTTVTALVAGTVALALAASALGGLQLGEDSGRVVIGADNDSPDDPVIQNGAAANQSLRKGDQIIGDQTDEVQIGRLGPDVLLAEGGHDVIVGGTERNSDVVNFPNFDIADGEDGNDAFIWAPGDGSDAFLGGEPARRPGSDMDRLIVGTMEVDEDDDSLPQLNRTEFGRLPRAIVSNNRLPATIGGDSNPTATVPNTCDVVRAPRGLGYNFLVRVINPVTGAQAVTLRLKEVEQVLCGAGGQGEARRGIVATSLGVRGKGPVRSVDGFRPARGSRLDQLVD